uniref:FSA_C domain-containing protein n=1 Tax=Heterorhabditis bacteriophora TaxID=37862 RepID=A0A1I7XD73_HETBA
MDGIQSLRRTSDEVDANAKLMHMIRSGHTWNKATRITPQLFYLQLYSQWIASDCEKLWLPL